MEKEVKNLKKTVLSGVLALAVAVGASSYVLIPTNAYATGSKIVTSKPTTKYTINKHKIGEYVDESTGKVYYTVEVIAGDNASKISETIIATYRRENQIPEADIKAFNAPNTKASRSSFWPAVVYLNTEPNKQFHIHPGDILVFPTEYKEFKDTQIAIKRNGWYSNYCQKNGVYPEVIVVYIDPEDAKKHVIDVVNHSYSDECVEVTDEYVRAFYDAIGYENLVFVFKDGAELESNDDRYYAYGYYVPSNEEVEKKLEKNKTNNKSK